PRPPMQWNEAIVVIGRCKRVCTASAARAVSRGVLPWIGSENPVPKAETTPLKRYTRRTWDARDPESLLQRPHAWDDAVQHFMAQVSRRRWWSRWWRRRKLAMSLPLTFTMLHAEREASEQRYAQRVPE